MKFSCHSCRRRYSVPDAKLNAAGRSGLRIRCTRCQAIMAVSRASGTGGQVFLASVASSEEESTRPGLPERKRPVGASLPEMTGVHEAGGENRPHPAVVNASGAFEPLPGVSRDVEGVRLAKRGSSKKRIWFAALEGTPKGPFLPNEMKELAAKGRLRGSTLVWRPGYSKWTRVRSRKNERSDLAWLRDLVVERKRQENAVEQQANRKLGIHKLMLDHQAGLPPPLPFDASEEPPGDTSPLPGIAADAVFGAPGLSIDVRSRPHAKATAGHQRRFAIRMGLVATLACVAGLAWYLHLL